MIVKRTDRQARTTHEATLEEVRKLEERQDAQASELQEMERRETTLRRVILVVLLVGLPIGYSRKMPSHLTVFHCQGI